MEEEINIGIGFVTGRQNVCSIINNYYKSVLGQFEKSDQKISLTFYLLFDLEYQKADRSNFYDINSQVYEKINIEYITPENIEETKKKLISREYFQVEELDLFFGHGHGKGRNTIMYYALRDKIDYLFFWDDDEYPIANVKTENGNIEWIKQDNILISLENMKNADVTIGHHCGYISPIPYLDFEKDIGKKEFENYISALSNDIISVKHIEELMIQSKGITYANIDIATGNGAYEMKNDNDNKWVAGSTLGLNLKNKSKIPAFYNPPGARGEDTFFSIHLKESKVIKVPIYHFHDGFLKYKKIMQEEYPKQLREIPIKEEETLSRFIQASKGWIKYKPLLMYITDKENYNKKIAEMYQKLKDSIPNMNKAFECDEFSQLLEILEEYHKNVELHYEQYRKTNEIWEKLKN